MTGIFTALAMARTLATISVIVSKAEVGKSSRGGGAEAGHVDGLEAGLLGELRLQAIEQ